MRIPNIFGATVFWRPRNHGVRGKCRSDLYHQTREPLALGSQDEG